MKTINLQIQEALQTLSSKTLQKISGHILIKLFRIDNTGKFLEAVREDKDTFHIEQQKTRIAADFSIETVA